MPVRKVFTVEFKEQAVRYVFEEIGPDESRSAAVERLGPKLNVRPATLMNWVKVAAAPAARPDPAPGSEPPWDPRGQTTPQNPGRFTLRGPTVDSPAW